MPVGTGDLIAIQVYDSPAMSRTARIGSDGCIRIAMLQKEVKVEGMMPAEIEKAVAAELQSEGILVNPVVSVSVAEYRSRPVSITGAVKAPANFQALPGTTLLDAVTRAGGLSEDAGNEIIVTRTVTDPNGKTTKVNQRILAKSLLNESDSAYNVPLFGGEEIRVPDAGRIFVVGNVKTPGAIKLHDTDNVTVFKAIALSEGLAPYAGKTAYVYRKEGGQAGQDGIPIELSKIMQRKTNDVPLQANDILYIPDNAGKRVTLTILERTVGLGIGVTSAVAIAAR
jgi:polysaccharide export outer membrane protein